MSFSRNSSTTAEQEYKDDFESKTPHDEHTNRHPFFLFNGEDYEPRAYKPEINPSPEDADIAKATFELAFALRKRNYRRAYAAIEKKALINVHFPVNYTSSDQNPNQDVQPLLHFAIERMDIALAKLLLDHGANPNLLSSSLTSALEVTISLLGYKVLDQVLKKKEKYTPDFFKRHHIKYKRERKIQVCDEDFTNTENMINLLLYYGMRPYYSWSHYFYMAYITLDNNAMDIKYKEKEIQAQNIALDFIHHKANALQKVKLWYIARKIKHQTNTDNKLICAYTYSINNIDKHIKKQTNWMLSQEKQNRHTYTKSLQASSDILPTVLMNIVMEYTNLPQELFYNQMDKYRSHSSFWNADPEFLLNERLVKKIKITLELIYTFIKTCTPKTSPPRDPESENEIADLITEYALEPAAELADEDDNANLLEENAKYLNESISLMRKFFS